MIVWWSSIYNFGLLIWSYNWKPEGRDLFLDSFVCHLPPRVLFCFSRGLRKHELPRLVLFIDQILWKRNLCLHRNLYNLGFLSEDLKSLLGKKKYCRWQIVWMNGLLSLLRVTCNVRFMGIFGWTNQSNFLIPKSMHKKD